MSANTYIEFLKPIERLAPRLIGKVAPSNSEWAVIIGYKARLFALYGLFPVGRGRGRRVKLCALFHIASLRLGGMLPLQRIQGLKGWQKLATAHFWVSRFFDVAFNLPRLRHITVG
jgi:hypothetical protein